MSGVCGAVDICIQCADYTTITVDRSSEDEPSMLLGSKTHISAYVARRSTDGFELTCDAPMRLELDDVP